MAKSLKVVSITQSDIPFLVNIYFNAFTTDFHKHALPDSVWTRKWFEQKLTKSMQDTNASFLKVVQTSSGDEGDIVAWALWSFLGSKSVKHQNHERIIWPEGADAVLCEQHFGELDQRHRGLMDGRQHWYLEYLATDPSHQNRGAGGMLLRHGLGTVDAAGLAAYLEAPVSAAPIYRKFGFEERSFVDVEWIGNEKPKVYRNWCMVRLAKV